MTDDRWDAGGDPAAWEGNEGWFDGDHQTTGFRTRTAEILFRALSVDANDEGYRRIYAVSDNRLSVETVDRMLRRIEREARRQGVVTIMRRTLDAIRRGAA